MKKDTVFFCLFLSDEEFAVIWFEGEHRDAWLENKKLEINE